MKTQRWAVEYSKGIPDRFEGTPEIVLSKGKLLGMVTKTPPRVHTHSGPLHDQKVVVDLAVSLSRGAVINSNPGGEDVPDASAMATVILVKNMNDAVGSRWYGRNHRIPLTAGRHRISIPLELENWQGVYGHEVPEPWSQMAVIWAKTWRAETRLGLCFGGHFYGHGVSVGAGGLTLRVHRLSVV